MINVATRFRETLKLGGQALSGVLDGLGVVLSFILLMGSASRITDPTNQDMSLCLIAALGLGISFKRGFEIETPMEVVGLFAGTAPLGLLTVFSISYYMGIAVLLLFGIAIGLVGWMVLIAILFQVLTGKTVPIFKLEQSHIDELKATHQIYNQLQVGDEVGVRAIIPANNKAVISFKRWFGKGVAAEIELEKLPNDVKLKLEKDLLRMISSKVLE